jgi:hypothetical protein
MLLPVQESLRCQGAKKGRSVGYSKKEEFVMKKAFGRFLGITALATIICATGLAMSGAALAQQCVDNKDGTVTDKVSGLMWQTETAGPMTWYAATSYANSLSLGGKTGWRLPSRYELVKLYSSSPCLSMLSVKRYFYWSSTMWHTRPDFASLVNFLNGSAVYDFKSNSYYVRAVRTGQ